MASRSLIRQWHGAHGLLRKLAAPSMATNNLLKNTGSCRSYKYQTESSNLHHVQYDDPVEEEWDAQKVKRDAREALAREGVQRDRDPYESLGATEPPNEDYEFNGPCDMHTWYAWDFDPSAPRPNEHFDEECVLDLEQAGLLIKSNPEEPGPGLSLFTLLNCQRWIRKQTGTDKRAARLQKLSEIPSVKKILEGELMDEFISACKDPKLGEIPTMAQPFRWNSLENIEKHKELLGQLPEILEDYEETPEEWQDLKPLLEWRIEYINLMLFEQNSWEDIQFGMRWIDSNGDLDFHEEIDEIQPGYSAMVVDYIKHLQLQDAIWVKRFKGFCHRENAERAAAILQRWRAGEEFGPPTSNVEKKEQGEKAKRSFGLVPSLMGYGLLTTALVAVFGLWYAPPSAEAEAAEGGGGE